MKNADKNLILVLHLNIKVIFKIFNATFTNTYDHKNRHHRNFFNYTYINNMRKQLIL